MPEVELSQYLPKGARIVFSTLADPNTCDRYHRDVAAIRLPGGYGIDVTWIHADQRFALRLYLDTFDNDIVESFAYTPREVLEQLQEWGTQYSSETETKLVSLDSSARNSFIKVQR